MRSGSPSSVATSALCRGLSSDADPAVSGREGTTMEELARQAAEALAALGNCREGTWQQRKDALLSEGGHCDSGFDEVMGWFGVETE